MGNCQTAGDGRTVTSRSPPAGRRPSLPSAELAGRTSLSTSLASNPAMPLPQWTRAHDAATSVDRTPAEVSHTRCGASLPSNPAVSNSISLAAITMGVSSTTGSTDTPLGAGAGTAASRKKRRSAKPMRSVDLPVLCPGVARDPPVCMPTFLPVDDDHSSGSGRAALPHKASVRLTQPRTVRDRSGTEWEVPSLRLMRTDDAAAAAAAAAADAADAEDTSTPHVYRCRRLAASSHTNTSTTGSSGPPHGSGSHPSGSTSTIVLCAATVSAGCSTVGTNITGTDAAGASTAADISASASQHESAAAPHGRTPRYAAKPRDSVVVVTPRGLQRPLMVVGADTLQPVDADLLAELTSPLVPTRPCDAKQDSPQGPDVVARHRRRRATVPSSERPYIPVDFTSVMPERPCVFEGRRASQRSGSRTPSHSRGPGPAWSVVDIFAVGASVRSDCPTLQSRCGSFSLRTPARGSAPHRSGSLGGLAPVMASPDHCNTAALRGLFCPASESAAGVGPRPGESLRSLSSGSGPHCGSPARVVSAVSSASQVFRPPLFMQPSCIVGRNGALTLLANHDGTTPGTDARLRHGGPQQTLSVSGSSATTPTNSSGVLHGSRARLELSLVPADFGPMCRSMSAANAEGIAAPARTGGGAFTPDASPASEESHIASPIIQMKEM